MNPARATYQRHPHPCLLAVAAPIATAFVAVIYYLLVFLAGVVAGSDPWVVGVAVIAAAWLAVCMATVAVLLYAWWS